MGCSLLIVDLEEKELEALSRQPGNTDEEVSTRIERYLQGGHMIHCPNKDAWESKKGH